MYAHSFKVNLANRFSLTLSMLRLLSSKAQERRQFFKPLKPCHVGIHWKALAESFLMSTNFPGFLSFSSADSSTRVNKKIKLWSDK